MNIFITILVIVLFALFILSAGVLVFGIIFGNLGYDTDDNDDDRIFK